MRINAVARRKSGFWLNGFGAEDEEKPPAETPEEKEARLKAERAARISAEGRSWFDTLVDAFKDDDKKTGDKKNGKNGDDDKGFAAGIAPSALLIPGALVLGIFLLTRKK